MKNTSIKVIHQNIVDMEVDCVVNAANSRLLQGGGVCGALFRAAGSRQLQAACDAIGYCECGKAVITSGFNLKAKNIIHAVGPIWNGGSCNEPELLYSCYQNALKILLENGGRSIAFPFISSGIYGYPKKQAWEQAFQSCIDFVKANEDAEVEIFFAVLDSKDAVEAQALCDYMWEQV